MQFAMRPKLQPHIRVEWPQQTADNRNEFMRLLLAAIEELKLARKPTRGGRKRKSPPDEETAVSTATSSLSTAERRAQQRFVFGQRQILRCLDSAAVVDGDDPNHGRLDLVVYDSDVLKPTPVGMFIGAQLATHPRSGCALAVENLAQLLASALRQPQARAFAIRSATCSSKSDDSVSSDQTHCIARLITFAQSNMRSVQYHIAGPSSDTSKTDGNSTAKQNRKRSSCYSPSELKYDVQNSARKVKCASKKRKNRLP